MNQKGEVTLITTLLMFILLGIVLLSSLELKSSFRKLQRRTELFLCVKETKGEINLFLKFMGRTNWAIKNMPLKLTMEKLAIYEGPSKIFVPRSEIPPGVIILSLGQDDWEHVIYPSRFEGWIKKSNALKELGE